MGRNRQLPIIHVLLSIWGTTTNRKQHLVSAARKTRTIQKFAQYNPPEKKPPKTEVEQTDVKVDNSGESELKLTVDNLR